MTLDGGKDLVTLINSFSCEPQNKRHLVDSWVRATQQVLGQMPGIISAALHRSDEGTRVVNYAQWHAAENRKCLPRVGRESRFREMAKFGKPDPHLYAVYFLLDKSDRQSR